MSTCISALYLCPSDSPFQLDALWIVTWTHGCPYVGICVCANHFTSDNKPGLECVHASVHMFMSIWPLVSPQSSMYCYTETWGPLCGNVFVSQSPHFCSHTLFSMCTCISTCIYVHLTPHVFSTSYCSHPTSVHASVHEFMSTWLPMSALSHLNSFMKTWVPLCDIVCLSESSYFWSHTFVRICTCISTCIYVHLTPHFSLIPCGLLHGKMCVPV